MFIRNRGHFCFENDSTRTYSLKPLAVICSLIAPHAFSQVTTICTPITNDRARSTCEAMIAEYPGVYTLVRVIDGDFGDLDDLDSSDNNKLFIFANTGNDLESSGYNPTSKGTISVRGARNIAFVGVTDSNGSGPHLKIDEDIVIPPDPDNPGTKRLENFVHSENTENLLFKNLQVEDDRTSDHRDLVRYFHINNGANVTFDNVHLTDHASISKEYTLVDNVEGSVSFRGCLFDHGSSIDYGVTHAIKFRNCQNVELADTEFRDIDFVEEMIELENPRIFNIHNTRFDAHANVDFRVSSDAVVRLVFKTQQQGVDGHFEGVTLSRNNGAVPSNWPAIIIQSSGSGDSSTGEITILDSSFNADDVVRKPNSNSLPGISIIDVMPVEPGTTGTEAPTDSTETDEPTDVPTMKMIGTPNHVTIMVGTEKFTALPGYVKPSPAPQEQTSPEASSTFPTLEVVISSSAAAELAVLYFGSMTIILPACKAGIKSCYIAYVATASLIKGISFYQNTMRGGGSPKRTGEGSDYFVNDVEGDYQYSQSPNPAESNEKDDL